MDTLTLRKDTFYQSILACAKSVIKQKDVQAYIFPNESGEETIIPKNVILNSVSVISKVEGDV